MDIPSTEPHIASQLAMPQPSSPHQRVPGIWMAFGMIGLYFVLQVAASLLLAIVLGVIEELRHPGGANVRDAVQALMQHPAMRSILVMFSLGVAATSVLLLTYRKWPQLWARSQPPGFGFSLPRRTRFFALAILLGLATPMLGGLMTQWLAHGQKVTQDIQQLGGQTPLALRIPLVLLVISLGPLIEELLFRGVLLSSLLQRWRTMPSVLITSVLFALVHLSGLQFQWFALPQLLLLALLLAWLRLRSGSIWPAVVAHGTHNLLAVTAWFVAVKPT